MVAPVITIPSRPKAWMGEAISSLLPPIVSALHSVLSKPGFVIPKYPIILKMWKLQVVYCMLG